MTENLSKNHQKFTSEVDLETSSKMKIQIIQMDGKDDNCLHNIYENDVLILPSKASGKNGNVDASRKVKFQSIVKYDWEQKYYYGNLVVSHINKTHFAYILKGKSGGVVRVANKESNQRILLKGFCGVVVDIAFASIEDRVVLAVVDSVGCLYVYEMKETDAKLSEELLLQSTRTEDQLACKFHRLVWCSYINEDPSTTPSSPTTSSTTSPPSSPLPPIDDSLMLLLTHNQAAELWHIDLIMRSTSSIVVDARELKSGHYRVSSHYKAIVDAAFSPDGTAVATASLDGDVKFFQINMADSQILKLVHQWQPHNGRPVSFMHFLDDHQNKNPEVQLWKFVVTGCSMNAELKLWNCQMWSCIQTLYFHPSIPHPSIIPPSILHSSILPHPSIRKNSLLNERKACINDKNNNNNNNGFGIKEDDDEDDDEEEDDDADKSLGSAVEFRCGDDDNENDDDDNDIDSLKDFKGINGSFESDNNNNNRNNNGNVNGNNSNAENNSNNNINSSNNNISNSGDLIDSVCMKVRFDISSSFLIMSDINRQVIYILHLNKDPKLENMSFNMVGEFLLNQSCLSFDISDIQLVNKDYLDNNENMPLAGKETNYDSDDDESSNDVKMISAFLFTVHPKCLQSMQVHYSVSEVEHDDDDFIHSFDDTYSKSRQFLQSRKGQSSESKQAKLHQPVHQSQHSEIEKLAHFVPSMSSTFPQAPFQLLSSFFTRQLEKQDDNKEITNTCNIVIHNKTTTHYQTKTSNKNDDVDEEEEGKNNVRRHDERRYNDGERDDGGGGERGEDDGGGEKGEDDGGGERGLVEGADRDRPDGGARVGMVTGVSQQQLTTTQQQLTTTQQQLTTTQLTTTQQQQQDGIPAPQRFFDREGDGVCDGGDGSSDASSASLEVTEIFESVVDDEEEEEEEDDNETDKNDEEDDEEDAVQIRMIYLEPLFPPSNPPSLIQSSEINHQTMTSSYPPPQTIHPLSLAVNPSTYLSSQPILPSSKIIQLSSQSFNPSPQPIHPISKPSFLSSHPIHSSCQTTLPLSHTIHSSPHSIHPSSHPIHLSSHPIHPSTHIPLKWPQVDDLMRKSEAIENRTRSVQSPSIKDMTVVQLSSQLADLMEICRTQNKQMRNMRTLMQQQQHENNVCITSLTKEIKLLSQQVGKQLDKQTDTPNDHLEKQLEEHNRQLQQTYNCSIKQLHMRLNTDLEKHVEIALTKYFSSFYPKLEESLKMTREKLMTEVSMKLKNTDINLSNTIIKTLKSKQSTDALKEAVTNEVKTCLRLLHQDVTVPSMNKATQALFKQINSSFSLGTQQYIHKLESYLEQTHKAFDINKHPLMQQLKTSIVKLQQHETQLNTQLNTLNQSLQTSFNKLNTEIQSNTSRKDNHVLSKLESLQKHLTSNVASAVSNELKNLLQVQQLVIKDQFDAALRTITPTPSSSANEVKTKISSLIKEDNIDAAFQMALSAMDITLVEYVCENVEVIHVFSDPTPISQSNLLSLIQQLSTDLNSKTELKYKFLDEALLSLDTTDAVTHEHLKSILTQLSHNLMVYIKKQKPSNPLFHPISHFLKRVKFFLKSHISNNQHSHSAF